MLRVPQAGESMIRRTPMNTHIGRILTNLLLAMSLLLLIPGCDDVSGAPTIPPTETFLIPFEAFTDNGASSLASVVESPMRTSPLSFRVSEERLLSPSQSGSQSNRNHAAFNVGFWNLAVVVGLAVPVAAFQASFRNIPLQQEDGSWVWSYDVRIDGTVHSAKLHGQFITEGVRWEMRISKEGEYEDFLWYYGESDLPATDGFWILKQSPAVPEDLLRIDWSRNISAETHTIRYTNIVPDGPENGGYIDARHTDDTPYDRIWDIYNKGQDNHTYIEWSSATGEGRVKDVKHFDDEEWHCWDSDRLNVVCP
jgi:hypothetical protein